MSDQNPKQRPRLQIQLDDDTAQGTYSNLVLINHSENEFLLDFAFFAPGSARAKVRTRIVSTPRHTKRLLKALQTNLERYEERFGKIELADVDEDEPIVN